MKNSVFTLAILTVTLSLTSCKTNKMAAETTESATETTTEVWEGGTMTISGKISDVKQEKDGQTITLTNSKGITYTAVISIPNLGENHAQYRKFQVGEEASFKGELFENQRLIVREVLELR